MKKKLTHEKEIFEKIPLYASFFAHIGFYILLFLGYVNQFLFSPKVAKERNREVSAIYFDYEIKITYIYN